MLPLEYSQGEKTKARRSGRSLLTKAEQLGAKARIFSLGLYWEPTHRQYRLAMNVPDGWPVPSIDELVAEYLSGRDRLSRRRLSSPLSPRRASGRVGKTSRPQPNGQSGLRRSVRQRSRRARTQPDADPYALVVDEMDADGPVAAGSYTRADAASTREGGVGYDEPAVAQGEVAITSPPTGTPVAIQDGMDAHGAESDDMSFMQLLQGGGFPDDFQMPADPSSPAAWPRCDVGTSEGHVLDPITNNLHSQPLINQPAVNQPPIGGCPRPSRLAIVRQLLMRELPRFLDILLSSQKKMCQPESWAESESQSIGLW